jgi:hypothetical protein
MLVPRRPSQPRPRAPRRWRDRQRGNSLLLALIVLSSLATLGSLTVVSVQSSLRASTNDRSQTIAMYAAESGGAAAMVFLRDPAHFDPNLGWSAYVRRDGEPKQLTPTELPSNEALPGSPDNMFSPDLNAYFVVELINNRSDDQYLSTPPTPPGLLAPNNDHDGIVIIRSTGHGPQGSRAIIEWEVQRIAPPAPGTPPPATDPIPPPPPPPWTVPPASQALHIRSWRVVL